MNKHVQKEPSNMSIEKRFSIQYIDQASIDSPKESLYETGDVEELAEHIQQNGLYHHLLVRPKSDGRYELISGARRFQAMALLVDKGFKVYKKIPCYVMELGDIEAEELSMEINDTGRTLTEKEILQQIERLKAYFEEKGEKTPESIRDLITKTLYIVEKNKKKKGI